MALNILDYLGSYPEIEPPYIPQLEAAHTLWTARRATKVSSSSARKCTGCGATEHRSDNTKCPNYAAMQGRAMGRLLTFGG